MHPSDVWFKLTIKAQCDIDIDLRGDMVGVALTDLVVDCVIVGLRIPGPPATRSINWKQYDASVNVMKENMKVALYHQQIHTKWTVSQIRTCVIDCEIPQSHNGSREAWAS